MYNTEARVRDIVEKQSIMYNTEARVRDNSTR